MALSSSSLRFKAHLNAHVPKDVLTPEEYEELRTECRQSKKEKSEQAEGEEEERPPGEEEPEDSAIDGKDSVSCVWAQHQTVDFQWLPTQGSLILQ